MSIYKELLQLINKEKNHINKRMGNSLSRSLKKYKKNGQQAMKDAQLTTEDNTSYFSRLLKFKD